MDERFGKRTGSDLPFPDQRVPLESETLRQLDVAFTPKLRDEARRILEEQCGKNIPGWEIFSIADLRVTIIKASGGSLERLQRAVDLAKVDFRDAFSLLNGSVPEDLLEAIPARAPRAKPVPCTLLHQPRSRTICWQDWLNEEYRLLDSPSQRSDYLMLDDRAVGGTY